mgnify:CR=1 FL=1
MNAVTTTEARTVNTAASSAANVLQAADPKAIHASAGPTRAANAPNNTVVPFHPGALRFYREQGVSGVK